MSPRPNELADEARPNVLTPGGGGPSAQRPVRPTVAPSRGPAQWASSTPAQNAASRRGPSPSPSPNVTPGASPAPAATTRPTRRSRPSVGVWIVLAVLVFNVVRALSGRISFDGGAANQPASLEPTAALATVPGDVVTEPQGAGPSSSGREWARTAKCSIPG
jgi:hypothetical protein